MTNPRLLLATVVAVAAVAVGVVLVAGGSEGGGSSGEPVRKTRARLTLERAVEPQAGYEELVVSLPSRRLNSPATNGGAASVLLRCVGGEGRATIRQRHRWPLVEEEGYQPHIHQPAAAKVLDGLRSCRLTGRAIDFEGRVEGRLPSLEPAR